MDSKIKLRIQQQDSAWVKNRQVNSQEKVVETLTRQLPYKYEKSKTILCIGGKSYYFESVQYKTWKDLIPNSQPNLHYIVTIRQRVNGGMKQFGTVTFNSTENVTSIRFNQIAPEWRIVTKGLNLQGKCNNKDCQAYGKLVWIQKGFGQFLMNKETQISECPKCHKIATDINNFGYYNCKIKIEGMIEGEKNIIKKEDIHQGNEQMKTFKNGNEELRQWIYLKVEAIQL